MVTEIDFVRVHAVLGCEVFGSLEQSVVVLGHDTLDHWALALGCDIEGQFDVQVIVISFNHSVVNFLVNLIFLVKIN